MKLTFYILSGIVLFLFLANTTVQYKPFKVSFDTPFFAIGIFLIGFGISSIQIQAHKSAYKKGLEKGSELMQQQAIETALQIIEDEREPSKKDTLWTQEF